MIKYHVHLPTLQNLPNQAIALNGVLLDFTTFIVSYHRFVGFCCLNPTYTIRVPT
ncbi:MULTISPECIES: hypothetical protein [unclassified Moorena]|uniref:hypothetical protein n=1 Tax=unclassified Moorena TaxID=2683338 RepID=UPI0013FF6C33|nr:MULTISPECIES: hypothetical protein [unclassified Moorena]NEO16983.1 hypothetical protein [Moorena sp. SIO3E8]NEQ03583.1 hypothetical protein [Moorena sp. SIO3F7]